MQERVLECFPEMRGDWLPLKNRRSPPHTEMKTYAVACRESIERGLATMPGGGEQAGVFAALEAFERYFPEHGEGWIERAEGRAKRMVKAFLAALEILEIGLRDIPYEGWRDYTLGMGAVLRNIIRISSPRDLGQSRYQQKGGMLVAGLRY